ncbi:MBL fold metallo-hydrolase [uncultured Methanolobus sp.]|uniref:MBL fold metallo-hydrolase n=1 Tax=uncultured Methanolobus sp. TaxID=218300 RepID=UPI0029C74A9D|nr:MBL fold metallo-hydrolase [uncultured Methanolobus sp.]
MSSVTIDGILIKWLGNSGFMIKGDGMVLYIDPVNISGEVPEEDMADLLLITHEHFGHCDPDSIRKVRKSDCTTLIPNNMGLQFRGDARRVIEGDSLTGDLNIKGVDIEVIPAYDSCDGACYSGSGVGYFFIFGGLKIYHPGHTCTVPEWNFMAPDVAILPIGGPHGMDEAQSTIAVASLSPRIVIPIVHDFGEIDGTVPDSFVDMAKEKSPSTQVIIL